MFVRLSLDTLLLGLIVLVAVMTSAAPARAQAFTSVRHELPRLQNGALAWADYDDDGLYDLVMAGVNAEGALQGLVLQNRGDTSYVEGRALVHETRYRVVTLVLSLEHAAIAWADVNADGRPDFVLSGRTAAGPPAAALYLNNGVGGFERTDQVIEALYWGDAAWADFDRDGDVDLLLCGIDALGVYRTDLYENVGGTLVRRAVNLPGIAFGSVSWGDADGDGFPDVALTGVVQPQASLTAVYRNDGAGGFTPLSTDLEQLVFSSAAWGDYDGDGMPDLLISGGRWSPFVLDGVMRIYRNTGSGFQSVADRRGAYYGAASWGDFDNDGAPDGLVSGGTHPLLATTTAPTGSRAGFVYSGRDGRFDPMVLLDGGAFTFGGGYRGDVTVGDYDGDGDLDFIVTGVRGGGSTFTDVWRNEAAQVGNANRPPEAPTALMVETSGDGVRLSWEAASDPETPTAGLTYNVRIGRQQGGVDVLSPHAHPGSGRLLIPGNGNAGHATQLMIRNLPSGRYFAAVQAIDPGYIGSPFSAEIPFDVP